MIAVAAVVLLVAVAALAVHRPRPEPPERITEIASPRPLRNPRERR